MDGKQEAGKGDLVRWFFELNKNSGAISGGKGANLAEIYNLKIPVPPGFVVTSYAYEFFIKNAGVQEKINQLLSGINYENTSQLNKITKEIRNLIVKSSMPKELEEEIIQSYEDLGAVKLDPRDKTATDILKTSAEPIFVAVRSSATTEDLAEASFAGQQETFLNVKGIEELIHSVKKCFASLFTSRATYYRHKKEFKHGQAKLAVVVQKMVDSLKSGVIFSKDPTGETDNIIIEAVYGLGEGVVSGRITPDSYELSKNLEVINRKITDKKIAITRDSSGKQKVIKLNKERSNQQVLKEHEIKKLGDYAQILEEHFKKPQDIEFAIENGDIFIVQTRPVTTLGKKFAQERQELKGEEIFSGIPASPGIASGKVRIIKDLNDLKELIRGEVLVTTMTNPDMVVTMQKSLAIITDEGGLTSHAAIVSREMGVPSVVGTRIATQELKDGEVVTVDGYHGKVYRGKVAETEKKEIKPIKGNTKTQLKVIIDLPSFAKRASQTGIRSVGLARIEGTIAESGKHPNYFQKNNQIKEYVDVVYKGLTEIAEYFDELWVRTSDIRSDEFKNLEGAGKVEANPMLGMHGIRYGVTNPEILKAELLALKRISDKGKKIGVLLPQVISVEEVKKTKELLKEVNFEKAKIGVMIETPASVQIINSLCEDGIDFVSFGTNDLTQYILAVDRGNESVQSFYNEMHPAVLYQLEFVLRVCKRKGVETSICGQAGSKKEMVKFLVDRGINSVSVNADVASDIEEYIKEIEDNMIKGTDKEPRRYEPDKR